MARLGTVWRRQSNEIMRLIKTAILGVVVGFLIGISFLVVSIIKLHFPSSSISCVDDGHSDLGTKIYVPTNPRGAKSLAPGIIVPESDFYLRRLWGNPSEDLPIKQKYLVAFTVGLDQKHNIDAAVKKFSGNFTILLFHYDGRTSEWDDLEWSKRAIHVSVRKQTKWWYAKRFLHPDIVAPYDYIFIWDEEVGVEHFNAERYIELMKKHGLQISQPGLEPNKGSRWRMTRRRGDREVNNSVETLAAVFSRDAWQCVWHMIQNDLVHGWGLLFALRKCVEIDVPTHPRGAEGLAPGIIVPESDFYPRRLWGNPREDLPIKQKYLVTFTVGHDQKHNIDAAVKKFSENFTILLFHYDGRASEWDDLEWSNRAIHVSARKQTKWWYAKRFLHPDIVAPYDYIFIWDEDLGVEHFNAEKYIELVKKHGLEISQPGLQPNKGITWQMTKRRGDREVHKETEEKPGRCTSPHLPPCAAFVEIMATVFSRDAWRCVWHMIQNDLVHGWGLDFALRRCVEPAHEKIGVVDSQWIIHQVVPSLGSQGHAENGKAPWEGVRERCHKEWAMFQERMADAEKAYHKLMGPTP